MRRRIVAIAAMIVALAVAAPELGAPAGAAAAHSARRTITAGQKDKIQRYIRAHPQVLTTQKVKVRRTTAKKHRVKRRVSRKASRAQRKRNARKRKARAKARARKRRARRGAVVAKHRRGKNAKKKKKAGSSSSKSLIDWAAILFLLALPFIAVALLLFGTDYRRRPRAPSNKKRRGVLVVTPVGRKY